MSDNIIPPPNIDQKSDYELYNKINKLPILEPRNNITPSNYIMKSNSTKEIKILSTPTINNIKNNINTYSHRNGNTKCNTPNKRYIYSKFNNNSDKNNNYSSIFEECRKKIYNPSHMPLILQKNYSGIRSSNFQNSENFDDPFFEFKKYKVPPMKNFHNSIMSLNKSACMKKINKEYKEMKKELQKNGYEYLQSLNDENKPVKTGIYGPPSNIVSVIRAKMERLKYDGEYKGVDFDIKEIIKDEIMDAQVKLKRKPIKLDVSKYQKIRPAFLKKLDNLRYLSHMNRIRAINQNLNVPVIVKDGNAMLKLVGDAFDIFKVKKYNNIGMRDKSI